MVPNEGTVQLRIKGLKYSLANVFIILEIFNLLFEQRNKLISSAEEYKINI